jgi:hypothetical protein
LLIETVVTGGIAVLLMMEATFVEIQAMMTNVEAVRRMIQKQLLMTQVIVMTRMMVMVTMAAMEIIHNHLISFRLTIISGIILRITIKRKALCLRVNAKERQIVSQV